MVDPAYFEKMSKLLDQVIQERKAKAIDYEQYLKKIAELSKNVTNAGAGGLPAGIKSKAQRALYHNLVDNEVMALQIDETVKKVKKSDWRGNMAKENEIKAGLFKILKNQVEVERIFSIIEKQSEY